ncbi:MAG: hypothetical protein AB8H79_15835 [Myxococcota bacterium]
MMRPSTLAALFIATSAVLASSPALAATPKASTELRQDDGTRFPASQAFDGMLTTGWAEGEAGMGDGSWIELPFDRPVDVKTISLWPGNLAKGRRSLRENSRPRTVTITLFTTDKKEVTKEVRLQDGGQEKVGPQRVDIEIEGKARKLRITLNDSYEGGVFTDVYLAEVAVNFSSGAEPRIVERLKAYQDSTAGQKAQAKNRKEVVELFTKIKAEQFGDRESLQQIMDRAGDGAPHLRRQLTRVPYGFRIQALPPDADAIEALQKLEDSNAIPAFEMAALRSFGRTQRKYELQTEYFYALQELIGGGDRNIPFWGKEGWEDGALRSFGEPIALEADQFGDLYLSDTGNHRIQRFASTGRHDRIWGSAEPGIANVWFTGKRRFHVAGRAPGEKPGEFSNPVSIDMLPGKDANGFVVLDAKGRVQIFNEEGQPTIGWTVRSRDKLKSNVGGEGYIRYAKGKIVVAWGNEIFVYNQESEELKTWKTDDGAPNGMEVLKNGKLLFVFGSEAIQYSVDGFRHGSVIDVDDLGPGIESWDITLDNKKKLWAVTDTGVVAKFKKPGKVDSKISVSDVDLILPRMAVVDGLAYIVERDRILKVDILELLRKRDLAEEDAAEAAEGAE